jgi:hypothetical protein
MAGLASAALYVGQWQGVAQQGVAITRAIDDDGGICAMRWSPPSVGRVGVGVNMNMKMNVNVNVDVSASVWNAKAMRLDFDFRACAGLFEYTRSDEGRLWMGT